MRPTDRLAAENDRLRLRIEALERLAAESRQAEEARRQSEEETRRGAEEQRRREIAVLGRVTADVNASLNLDIGPQAGGRGRARVVGQRRGRRGPARERFRRDDLPLLVGRPRREQRHAARGRRHRAGGAGDVARSGGAHRSLRQRSEHRHGVRRRRRARDDRLAAGRADRHRQSRRGHHLRRQPALRGRSPSWTRRACSVWPTRPASPSRTHASFAVTSAGRRSWRCCTTSSACSPARSASTRSSRRCTRCWGACSTSAGCWPCAGMPDARTFELVWASAPGWSPDDTALETLVVERGRVIRTADYLATCQAEGVTPSAFAHGLRTRRWCR